MSRSLEDLSANVKALWKEMSTSFTALKSDFGTIRSQLQAGPMHIASCEEWEMPVVGRAQPLGHITVGLVKSSQSNFTNNKAQRNIVLLVLVRHTHLLR